MTKCTQITTFTCYYGVWLWIGDFPETNATHSGAILCWNKGHKIWMGQCDLSQVSIKLTSRLYKIRPSLVQALNEVSINSGISKPDAKFIWWVLCSFQPFLNFTNNFQKYGVCTQEIRPGSRYFIFQNISLHHVCVPMFLKFSEKILKFNLRELL